MPVANAAEVSAATLLQSGSDENFNVASVNGTNVFRGADGKLWKTDGTTDGTVKISDVKPRGAFTLFGGALFFNGNDGTHGHELWKTDGTTEGTVMVKEIVTGTDCCGNPVGGDPSHLMAHNGLLYFSARDIYSIEPWVSDGTEEGTRLLKDINPGGSSSDPQSFTAFGSKVLFVAASPKPGSDAFDHNENRQLWETDGTTDRTQLVKDINPSSDTFIFSLTVFNGSLYFWGGSVINSEQLWSLWKSDGTTNGTVVFNDSQQAITSDMGVAGSNMFFTGFDATHGYELWKTDGTTGGTVLFKDINTAACGDDIYACSSFLGNFMALDSNTLVFGVNEGQQLWRTDGTEVGTFAFAPNATGYRSIFNGKIYFAGYDEEHGRELWQSDGTVAGTSLLYELRPGPDNHSDPYAIALIDDILYVGTETTDGTNWTRELWALSISADTTAPTTTISPGTPDGLNDWFTSNVRLTVSASDNEGGSGLAETRCILNPSSAPASFDDIPSGCSYAGAGADVTTDGQHTLYAASKDAAGNTETPVITSFKIDKTPPTVVITSVVTAKDGFMPAQTITSFPATVGAQPVTLNGTVSDSGSGVASVTVEGNAATFSSGTWSKSGIGLAVGSNTLRANATDEAGNTLALPVSVSVALSLDLDGDGIANNLDGNSTVSPAVSKALIACTVGSATEPCRFSDKELGGQTSGQVTVVPTGMSFTLTDAVGTALKGSATVPAGLNLTVTGSTGQQVRLTLDAMAGVHRYTAGAYVVTDPAGTVIVETIAGGPAEIEYTLNGSLVVIAIAEGASATITETTDSSGVLTDVAVTDVTGNEGDVTVNGETVPPGGDPVLLAALQAKLSVQRGQFTLSGTFSPPGSTAINPAAQDVTLKVGSYTFAVGTLTQGKGGAYTFNGTVDGVALSLELKQARGGQWSVKASGKPVSGFANPVTVSLRIGDMVGSAQVTASLK